MNYFVKGNPDLCMGCRTCMIACVVAHEQRPIFEINPDSYVFNPKLNMVRTARISVPVQCKHCENPACMAACPQECISIRDHAVIIDTKKCIGCKNCMNACPVGAINMVTVYGDVQDDGKQRMVANKCDLCTGIEGGPACVRVCPNDALILVKEDKIDQSVEQRRAEIAKARALKKE